MGFGAIYSQKQAVFWGVVLSILLTACQATLIRGEEDTSPDTTDDGSDTGGGGASTTGGTGGGAASDDVVYTFPLDPSNPRQPLIQGVEGTVSETVGADLDGVPESITCTVERLQNFSGDTRWIAGGTDCSEIPSLITVNGVLTRGFAEFSSDLSARTGTLVWTPTVDQLGTYTLTYTATRGSSSATTTIDVTVRSAFDSTNLVQAYDAELMFSNVAEALPMGPHGSGAWDVWLSLTGGMAAFVSDAATEFSRTGDMTSQNPVGVRVGGSDHDRFDLGNPFVGMTRARISMWAQMHSDWTPSTPLLSNADVGTGNGFTLQWDSIAPNLELRPGGAASNSYVKEVLADSPSLYYRLGERFANRLTGYARNSGEPSMDLGYSSGEYGRMSTPQPTLGAAGALPGDPDTAAYFAGGANLAAFLCDTPTTYSVSYLMDTFTFEALVNLDSIVGSTHPVMDRGNAIQWYVDSDGTVVVQLESSGGEWVKMTSSVSLSASTWYHLAFSYDGSGAASGIRLYIDGVHDTGAIASNSGGAFAYDTPAGLLVWGKSTVSGDSLGGFLDELAVYPDQVLSAARLLAHQNARTVDHCATLGNPMGQTSVVYDGSHYELWDGPRRVCEVDATGGVGVGTHLNSGQSLLLGAATGTSMQSAISQVRIWASLTGDDLGMVADLRRDSRAGHGRYQDVPLETGALDSKLVVQLEASLANHGWKGFTASTCDHTNFVRTSYASSWIDLVSGETAFLEVDDPCEIMSGTPSGAGWSGDGSVASPYRLVRSSASLSDRDDLSFTASGADTEFSVEAWIQVPDVLGQKTIVRKQDEYWLSLEGSAVRLQLAQTGDPTTTRSGATASGAVSAGGWTHIAGAYDPGTGNARIWINGTEASVTMSDAGSYSAMGAGSANLWLADSQDGSTPMDGELASVRLHSAALDDAEVKGDCLLSERFFTSTPQAICAAP